MDLQTELSAVEAKLDAETDPTEVAVLAGRIIELKNEVAQGATGLPGFLASGASGGPVRGPTPPVQPPFKPVQDYTPPVQAPKPTPAPIAPVAPAQAAPVAPPAAPAAQSQTDQLARAAARVGVNPSRLPIALRPTRN